MGTFIKRVLSEWRDYQDKHSAPKTEHKHTTVPTTHTPVIVHTEIPVDHSNFEQTHGQETVNLLERSISDPKTWSDLEAFCKSGPTYLIIADTNLIPSQMRKAGFSGRDNALWFALSRTYAGFNWLPGNDGELQELWRNRDLISKWWGDYLYKITEIMKKAPSTTAIIIANDAVDHCGRQLGNATYGDMSLVRDRVEIGETVPD